MIVTGDIEKWLEERQARETAEQKAIDFSLAAQNWLEQSKQYKEQRDVWMMVAFVMFALVLVLSVVVWPN